jgi:NADH-quinone oxidoreductase subunit E
LEVVAKKLYWMLTEKEKLEILVEVKMYPHSQAACIDALRIVQKERRWVSDENVSDIADLLKISVEDVESVASFYSRVYRKPVGRNIILICDSMVCMMMGGESLYDYFSNMLGIKFAETTSDGRFTLLPISCLGDCDHAPSFMINEDLYNNLSKEKIEEVLEKYK